MLWSNFTVINEEKIFELITEDQWMMNILKAAKSLNLPDWWICAGFVCSKIWEHYIISMKELQSQILI